ncbi:hypothetical protein [Methanolobus sp. ZRKC5]|uniref:hypothetical protein n=1 Tax=unclassified Methanolobus TaxID=2629569 RepID=UPI00313DDF39
MSSLKFDLDQLLAPTIFLIIMLPVIYFTLDTLDSSYEVDEDSQWYEAKKDSKKDIQDLIAIMVFVATPSAITIYLIIKKYLQL